MTDDERFALLATRAGYRRGTAAAIAALNQALEHTRTRSAIEATKWIHIAMRELETARASDT